MVEYSVSNTAENGVLNRVIFAALNTNANDVDYPHSHADGESHEDAYSYGDRYGDTDGDLIANAYPDKHDDAN